MESPEQPPPAPRSPLHRLLQIDINDSVSTLTPAFETLCSTAPLNTSGDDLSHILACAEQLVAFTQILGATTVARKWTPTADLCATGHPPLRAKLYKTVAWLVDSPSENSLDHLDEIRYCTEVLKLAAGKNPIPSVWQALFDLFAPQLPSNAARTSKSLTRTKNTPHKDSSGSKLGMNETHQAVDIALGIELDNLLYPDITGFFETYFPSQDLAFESSRKLRDADDKWTHWPAGAGQDDVIAWFFKTSDAILGPKRVRQYYSSRNKIIAGSNARRKADIFLAPKTEGRRKNNDEMANWSEIAVVGELKESPGANASAELLIQVAGYVREIFGSQHNRRFVHAFTLTKEYLRCWIFHRGGGFGSERININRDPKTFVDVVAGYGRMSLEELGFDPTLTFDHFQMAGCSDTFTINKKALFWRKSIASRGTTCFDVTKLGDSEPLYVLKEAWRGFGHDSEVTLLRKAQMAGVHGLTEYLAYEDVKINGMVDDIRGNIMKGLSLDTSPTRLVFPNLAGVESPPFFATFQAAAAKKPSQADPFAQPAYKPCSEALSQSRQDITTLTTPPVSTHSTNTATSTPPLVLSGGPASRTRSRDGNVPSAPAVQVPRKRKSTTLLVASSQKVSRQRSPPPEFNRIHSRILMRKAREIYNFTTPQELLLGLHDALDGHRSLHTAGILHRDISIFNIMLSLHTPTRDDGKRGFLIDLDMAIDMASLTPSTAPHRTGTREFMAIEILHGKQVTAHTYRHDIESFFYVFVWICVYGDWWHGNVETPLRNWARGSMEQSGMYKMVNMRRGQPSGWQTVEECFQEWAEELKEVAECWRSVLFRVEGVDGNMELGTPEDPDALYEPVLRLLRDSAKRLDERAEGKVLSSSPEID